MAKPSRFDSAYAPGNMMIVSSVRRQRRRQQRTVPPEHRPYLFGWLGTNSVPITSRSVLLPPSITSDVQFNNRVLPIIQSYRLAMSNYGWNEENGQMVVTFKNDESAAIFYMAVADWE